MTVNLLPGTNYFWGMAKCGYSTSLHTDRVSAAAEEDWIDKVWSKVVGNLNVFNQFDLHDREDEAWVEMISAFWANQFGLRPVELDLNYIDFDCYRCESTGKLPLLLVRSGGRTVDVYSGENFDDISSCVFADLASITSRLNASTNAI